MSILPFEVAAIGFNILGFAVRTRRASFNAMSASMLSMVREAADAISLGLGDRWKGISIASDLDDIAYSMLTALRRKALGE